MADPRTLFYVPLEGYKERYTSQWAAPKTGWLERNWIKDRIQYRRIEGQLSEAEMNKPITKGVVLDPLKRSKWCFSQISQILDLMNEGQITDNDVLLFDDFWTPGIEALPYAFDLFGVHPKMYAFLHAQSVDQYDFTYRMRDWMRPFETGIGAALAGIFVCCPTLKDLVVLGGIAPTEKVWVTGHPFNSEEVMERMPDHYREGPKTWKISRLPRVVWSSRWDREKDPHTFLKAAEKVIYTSANYVQFIICTGAKELRSNDSNLLVLLKKYIERFPRNIYLAEGLTKEQYYQILATSKIQVNTALQDWVAITLLEASVAGCYPIYPEFRSFPETFLHQPGFMYERGNPDALAKMILEVLRYPEETWSKEEIEKRAWIHKRFDTSWERMLCVMGYSKYKMTDPYINPWGI